MGLLTAIFGAILAIFSVVIIHEFGHFIVARSVGVRVLRFSIGFGKPVWSKTTKKGTEFAIGWLPLGGYVRMLGEGDEAPPEAMQRFSYNNKSVYQRMAIVLAGPLMNFLFAIFLYWILLLPGVVHIKPIIGQVIPNSIAVQAGLQPMDQIITVDGKPVKNWQAVIMAMIARMGDKKEMTMTLIHPPTTLIRRVAFPLTHWKLDQRNPQFLQSLGIVPYQPKFPMIIKSVLPNSPAQKMGLRAGDRILAVDGKKFDDMLDLVTLIQQHSGKLMHFRILRDGRQKTLEIKIASKKRNGKAHGFLGFHLTMPTWPAWMLEKEKYSVLTAWKPALYQTGALIAFNGMVLGKMILRKISLRTLGGPISIFRMAGQASQRSYRVYLAFLAFFSVTLGFINLLPIPGLDGGHFFFQAIEVIFRRPVPSHIQALCLRIGLILLILLILNATFNDLSRIFTTT